MILFECKNWSSKIHSSDIRNFAQKIQNRPPSLCNIGVLVTTSKLTDDASAELLGYRGKNFIIAVLQKTDIENILTEGVSLSLILKNAITDAGMR